MSDSKIESAKTGRSKCRKCRDKIEKDTLRMGIISYQFDSDGSWGWHHLACGAAVNPAGFETAVEEYDGTIDGIDELRVEAKKAARKTLVPRVEPAPSGRAACQKCGDKITPKGTLRVVIEREVEEQEGMTRPGYIHVACANGFVEVEGNLKELLLANSDLEPEDLATFNADYK
jgi:hypothetical protein